MKPPPSSAVRWAPFVALLTTLAFPSSATGQWPAQGNFAERVNGLISTRVGDPLGTQFWPSLCSDRYGGALVSWFGADGDSSAVFVELYEWGAPRWGGFGVYIKGLPFQPPPDPMYQPPTGLGVASDRAGGAYVLWPDLDSESNGVFRLLRVAQWGSAADGWPVDGLLIAPPGFQTGATLIADGSGGVYVAWSDMRDGDLHVRVQRYTASGQIAPGWPAAGVRPNGGFNSQRDPVLCLDGQTGVWVGWIHEGSLVKNSPSNLTYVRVIQRITAGGSVDPAWPSGGVTVGGYDGYADLGLVYDNTGGVFALWNGSDACARYGLFVQRLTPTGVPAGWPACGVRYADTATEFLARSAVGDGQGGVLSAWGSYEAAAGRVMTRVQRLRADGTIQPNWDPAGVPLGFKAEDVRPPLPVADNSGGVYVVWPDSAIGGGEVDLFRNRVGLTGGTWGRSNVCTAPGKQGACQVAMGRGGSAYVVWVDQRDDPGDIYITELGDFNMDVPFDPLPSRGALQLGAPRPNPFRDQVELGLTLTRGAHVTAEIIDVTGRRTRLLERGRRDAGSHVVAWDGVDDLGRGSAAGLYWVVVRAGDDMAISRLLRLD